MNPIVLFVTVVIEAYLDKTMLNPGSGIQIKGIDELSVQLKLSTDLLEIIKPNLPAEIIKNQEDKNNNIFIFLPDSEEVKVFKASLRGT